MLCINHQCHIDAPLRTYALSKSLECYSGSGAWSENQPLNASVAAVLLSPHLRTRISDRPFVMADIADEQERSLETRHFAPKYTPEKTKLYKDFVTEQLAPPYQDLDNFYYEYCQSAKDWVDKGLTLKGVGSAFVSFMNFFADGTGSTHTRMCCEPVWQQQLRLECISEQMETEDMDTESDQPADKSADELAAAAAKPVETPADNPAAATQAVTHKAAATAADNADSARDALIRSILNNSQLTDEHKLEQINNIHKLHEGRPLPVSSLRSSSRSNPPEPFHGHASDHGQTANTWL